ncbi:major facilitator superfamily domain-containing protein [Lasiosphaeris hirsuta]|uniref:Major facilitator superfamily domain-containing protein n=1 Tax=Lasiosphaeris hirsuta TaxID=260670 RepID=A0AA40E9D9_9PEZI|nr:major facilitator superfamily domain-containing protein [Lasiosphaeris hirsuta]
MAEVADNPRLAEAGTKVERVGHIQKRTLGNVRLRHLDTNKIILIPTPSSDPNDPLNWSQGYKYYITAVICFAMLMCNFLAAGPTIAMVSTAMDFFPGANPATNPAFFGESVAKVAFFFTGTALLQGMGNFIWVPIANKYGRRPTYVLSYLIYTGCGIWLCFDHSYNGFLAGRIMMGFGAGAAETIAPITIADVFFLHERGTVMSLYTSFLSVGVAFGVIISGLITIHHEWRVIYEVATPLVGLVLLISFFAFPETAYIRDHKQLQSQSDSDPGSPGPLEKSHIATSDVEHHTPSPPAAPTKPKLTMKTYLEALKIFHGTLTDESLLKLFVRPIGLICLPPVLWAALVQSVTIGFLVAVTSNVDVAFQTAYGFQSWQVGLCFVAAIIGSLTGIPAGGHLGDKVADWFTRRSGGVRDPEMRLPAMIPSLITTPLALILYGVGIEHKLHWMCPTVGLGLINFSIVQGTNVCLVYVIDAYRPVAGEVTLAVMGFKSLFGFLLSFYTNTWVAQSGYQDAYGVMAAIAAAVILMWVPLFVWGKRVRHATWSWPVISYIHWDDDREVGE